MASTTFLRLIAPSISAPIMPRPFRTPPLAGGDLHPLAFGYIGLANGDYTGRPREPRPPPPLRGPDDPLHRREAHQVGALDVAHALLAGGVQHQARGRHQPSRA